MAKVGGWQLAKIRGRAGPSLLLFIFNTKVVRLTLLKKQELIGIAGTLSEVDFQLIAPRLRHVWESHSPKTSGVSGHARARRTAVDES